MGQSQVADFQDWQSWVACVIFYTRYNLHTKRRDAVRRCIPFVTLALYRGIAQGNRLTFKWDTYLNF